MIFLRREFKLPAIFMLGLGVWLLWFVLVVSPEAMAEGVCDFSEARWSKTNVAVGQSVGLGVRGTTVSCQGMSFQFEIWKGSADCRGVGNRLAATLDSSFPAGGDLPLSAQTEWSVPERAQYCFKIRLPGVDNCARIANGNCLWSGALEARGDRDDEESGPVFLEFVNPLKARDIGELLRGILGWLFAIAIPIAVVMIIYAGILMSAAAGDPKRFEQGRKVLLWAVIGLVVIFIGEGFIVLIRSILEVGR